MPIIPDIVERLLLRFNKAPGPLFDIAGGISQKSIMAALKLGLFERLEKDSLTEIELAKQLQVSERGMGLLLRVLERSGYLCRKKKRWHNTKMSSKWLVAASPYSLANYFAMWQNMTFPFWDETLENTIQKGRPEPTLYQQFNHHSVGQFQAAMMEVARLFSKDVLDKLRIPPNALSLLDIGGGHGLYSIATCQKYAGLSATILDSAPALAIAGQNIAKVGLGGNRIRLLEGNYMTENIGEKYDVVLLFNVIHSNSPSENISLIQKAARALLSGGLLAILSMVSDGSRDLGVQPFVSLSDFTFFANFGGKVYSTEEIKSWLNGAGLARISSTKLRNWPGMRLIVAQCAS